MWVVKSYPHSFACFRESDKNSTVVRVVKKLPAILRRGGIGLDKEQGIFGYPISYPRDLEYKLIIKVQSLRAVASAGIDDTQLGSMQLRGNLPLISQPRRYADSYSKL